MNNNNFNWYYYWESIKRYSGTIIPINKNHKIEWIKYTPELIKYYCSIGKCYNNYHIAPIIIDAERFSD